MGAKEISRVFKNEFKVLSSDRKTLAIFLLGPILVIAIFGVATTQTGGFFKINVAVVDEDQSTFSNLIVSRFEQSQYMIIKYHTDRATAEELFREGKIDAIIIVEHGFDSKVRTFYLYASESQKATLTLVVDNSYFYAPVVIPLALQPVMMDFYLKDVPKILNLPADLSPEIIQQVAARMQVVYFNVQLAYGENIPFFTTIFPLLTPMFLFIFGLFMCGPTIVGERIRGTLPRLLKTPIRRSEIIIGKLLVYLVIALYDCIVVLLISTIAFGVIVKGGILELFASLFLIAFAGCTWGMFYSTFAKSERQISDLQTYTLTIAMVLGGMVFPISIMPEPMQVLANILPLTHSVNAVRAFAIKGLGLEYGLVDMGYMLAFGAAMLALALVSFRFLKE